MVQNWRKEIRDTYNILSIVGVGETDPDGLIDEEDVRVLVPRVRIESHIVGVMYCARPLERRLTLAYRH